MLRISRPSVYDAAAAFARSGLAGLVRAKPGPRNARKLGPEVMEFLGAELREGGPLSARALVKLVAKRFGLKVHPRSIERALARRRKNSTGSAAGGSGRGVVDWETVSSLYERMRAEVLEGQQIFPCSRRLGVFLRHGMLAWAEACLEGVPASGEYPHGSVQDPQPVATCDHGGVRVLLADLILGRRLEGGS